MLKTFKYLRPSNLSEALRSIHELANQNRPFVVGAGGTDLMPPLKNEALSTEFWISISGLEELCGIRVEKEVLRLGPLTTLAELSNHPDVMKWAPLVGRAAKYVGSPQIRNRGTLGGNILVNNRCIFFNQTVLNRLSHDPCYKAGGEVCHIVKRARRGDFPLCRARFVSDIAPALLILDARFKISNLKEERLEPAREFYVEDGIERNHLKPGELITEIQIDLPRPEVSSYLKLRIRNAFDFPSVGAAVGLRREGDFFVGSVALTGMNSHPVFFQMKETDFDALTTAAVSEAIKRSQPLAKQDFLPPSYRKKMAGVFVRRQFESLKKSLV